MCYRPLHINSKANYFNSCVSASSYSVPCGHCESCRDMYRSMWRCRLWHELDFTYKNGGCAVFLTFTYNNAHLPFYNYHGVTIPVFNHDDVKTFLNRLKIRCYRKFGKGCYKYFIAMEYGKTTKRQHLHGLFFLSSSVDYVEFCELCRELWIYGFMFPKYSHGRYVDDKGGDNSPLIRSAVKGAVYVSKYVTKDLSFYAIPEIDAVYKVDKLFFRHFGPKHYQSNNLGISILDKLDVSDKDSIVRFLTVGISVPYSDSAVPVPRYIRQRLLFDNVPSERLGRDGKYLYDSVPSDLSRSLGTLLYEAKASLLRSSVSKIFSRYQSLHPDFVIPSVPDMDLLCNYILYFSNVNVNVLHSFLTYYDGDVSSFSDFSKVGFFYNLSKDNAFLKCNQFHTSYLHDDFPYSTVLSPALIECYRLFCLASSECEEIQVNEFRKRSEERDNVRSKYFYKYDKKLC